VPSINNNLSVLLIGVGNEYRSDDGVGILAARRIREKNFPGIVIVESDGEAASLLDAWVGMKTVVVVDAVSSGAPPGTIHRIDARRQSVPQELFPFSSHALGLAHAVELARSLGKLPINIIIYGIEGEQFAAGSRLSPKVQEALNEVVQLVIGELFSLSDDALQNS
jgi:hydrogenase maturation protease